MKIGDVVVPSLETGKIFVCGSGRYTHAVIGSLDPFVLVSSDGSMLWSCTWEPNEVIPLCQASRSIVSKVLDRIHEFLSLPVYTVGNEKNYDEALLKKAGLTKTGRTEDYAGGFAVRSIEDAKRLIVEQGKEGRWAIYEMEAVWLKDTERSDNGWWHALLHDSPIIKKVWSA